jgi:hypothetical protein
MTQVLPIQLMDLGLPPALLKPLSTSLQPSKSPMPHVCLRPPFCLVDLANTLEVSDLLGEGWFKPFVLINLHAVNSIIMVIEMLCFNSIKRPLVLSLSCPIPRECN